MADWDPTAGPTITSGGTDDTGLTDTLHVVTGRAMADAGVGMADSGGVVGYEVDETDTQGLSSALSEDGPPTAVPATGTAALTLTATATGTNPNPGDTAISAEVLPSLRAVRITVTDLDGNDATLWRVDGAGAAPVEVRGAVQIESYDTLVVVDYEAPMDVALTYRAVVTAVTLVAAPVVIPSYGLDWLVSLTSPGAWSRVVTIESFPGLTRALSASTVRPLFSRYPAVISHTRTAAVGTLTLLTLELADAKALRSFIDSSPLVQLKSPQERGLPNNSTLYLLLGDYEEQRVVDFGNEPTRRWAITVAETDRPPLAILPPGENTWQDWDDEALGNASWDAWLDKSYLDLLIETLTGGS